MDSFLAGVMAKFAGLPRQATRSALGERFAAHAEGQNTGRALSRVRSQMATKSPIASLPQRYEHAFLSRWAKNAPGAGKAKPFLGNVGRAVKGVVRNLPR